MDSTTLWPPCPQTPLSAITRNVLINRIIPIIDQDELIPHPTPTVHKACYTGIPKNVSVVLPILLIGVQLVLEVVVRHAEGHARQHHYY